MANLRNQQPTPELRLECLKLALSTAYHGSSIDWVYRRTQSLIDIIMGRVPAELQILGTGDAELMTSETAQQIDLEEAIAAAVTATAQAEEYDPRRVDAVPMGAVTSGAD